MAVFVLLKKTLVQVLEPKRTNSVFDLSIWYQYCFLC
jgi:hypothetical protein